MPKEAKAKAEEGAGQFVVPGDVVCDTADGKAGGSGTTKRGSKYYATVAGRVVSAGEGLLAVKTRAAQNPVPSIGSIVLGKVKKVAGNFARIDIFCLRGKPCHTTFTGTIRTEDVRPETATSVDEIKRVEMWRCMKPNDIVRAEIISLGDQKAYHLSTLRDNLGVVYATSITGHQMVTLSASEMQCLGTGQTEPRKVALGESDFWWL